MLGRRHHTDTPPFFFFDFDAPEPILSGHAVLWLLLLACLALQQPRAYVRACVCRFQVVVLLLRTCSHARTIRPCTLRFAVLPPARPPTHARTHTQSETLTISPPPALPRSLGPPTQQPRVRLSFEAIETGGPNMQFLTESDWLEPVLFLKRHELPLILIRKKAHACSPPEVRVPSIAP